MATALIALIRLVAITLLLLSTSAISRAEVPIPPPPTAWVTDGVGLLSTQTVAEQNARLRDYERKTGHQILVYIGLTTGGVPIEDWSVRAFQKWKVGRKSLDDGLALFIFKQDRTLRIEVGYGMESRVPDVLAARIIRETIVPAIGAGEPDRGVTDGVGRILALTGDASSTITDRTGDEANSTVVNFSPVQIVFIVLLLIGLGVIAIRSPWLALMLLVNIFGGRGGGMSGEGGFSGGGGRSGGGGASGRW